jgi:KUP system potassium uptake protein
MTSEAPPVPETDETPGASELPSPAKGERNDPPSSPPPSLPPPSEHGHAPHGSVGALALAALGVVYGDIGTSPLYAIKECFARAHGVAPTAANVLGVLSLVTWSLLLVVVVKYISFILRADNRGEGGILALLALVASPSGNKTPTRPPCSSASASSAQRCCTATE